MTPSPKDTILGINVNKPLPQGWTRPGLADITRNLKGFRQFQQVIVPVVEDETGVKFIDTGVDALPPDKWRIDLIRDITFLAQSEPLDRYATTLFDVPKLVKEPQPSPPSSEISIPPSEPKIVTEPEKIPPPEKVEVSPDLGVTTTAPTTRVDVEPEKMVEKPKIQTPDLPFGFGWLKPLLDFFNAAFGNLKIWLDQSREDTKKQLEVSDAKTTGALKAVSDGLNPLIAFFSDPVGFVQKFFLGLVTGVGGSKEAIIQAAEVELVQRSLTEDQFKTPEMKEAVRKLREGMTGTPQDISGFVNTVFVAPAGAIREAIEAFIVPEPPVTFESARAAQNRLFALVVDFWVLGTILDIVSTAISVTLIRNIVHHTSNFIVMLNLGDLVKLATEPALNIAIKNPLEFGLNEKFLPNKIGVSDSIEAVVKEVIPLDDFKARMRRLGFDDTEAQIIWDKHFIPPTLSDILTAWRRGLITEQRVDELFVLVDLDPRFKNIFDTRKFLDPSLTLTRFMFETGTIDRERVRELVRRQGFIPEFVDNVTDFITRFQERLWKRRYIVTLARGYELEAVSADELRTLVVEAQFSEGVADWIIKTADLRRKISESKVKGKELTKTDVLRAFKKGEFTRVEAEEELQGMGYEAEAIETLLNLSEPAKE